MLLFKDKQARLLLMLSDSGREWYIADLAKAANVTYIHTSRFLGRCEEAGMVRSEKHGRMKRIFLTEKGIDVARGLADVIGRMQAPTPQAKPATQQTKEAVEK
jgi:DNA-binding MarR family transcriptional regulator